MAWAVLFVGWLSLHWLILPHIEQWRVPIEARVSRMLGAPVQIGAIEVRSSGWVPAIDLRDVRILDAQQRVALSLARVTAAFSTHSLLALEPRFEQLLIESPSLEVRRDAAGHIRVAGFDFGSSKVSADDGGAAADWLFNQHELVIRNGTVRWIDEARQAPPLALSGVDIVIRNSLRRHAMRIDATPPAEWGDRFSIRGRFEQPLLARAGDWRRWQGTVYAELPRADVRELRRHIELPFELSEGDGALRGWFDMSRGRPQAATVDVSLRAVALRLDKTVEPLEFAQVEGRIAARESANRTSVDVQGLSFVTGDGLRWPRGDLQLAWRQDAAGEVDGGEFAADRLDLGVMAGIASRVPLGAALRKLLAELHPQGTLTGLKTHWDGPLDAPAHYRVAGSLSGLSLSAHAAPIADVIGRPGLSGATIALVADETGGQARIGVKDGVLDVPGVFAEPALPLTSLDSHLTWKIAPARAAGEPPAITVKVDSAHFANADAQGDLTATWRTGPGTGLGHGSRYPGQLELEGRISNAQAIRTVRYLPLGLPDSVRDYIGRAVRGGTIPSATFRVRGDLADFPFHNAKSAADSEFHIAAKVEDLGFAYVPGAGGSASSTAALAAGTRAETWPPMTALSGELVIDRSTLEVKNARGRLAGVDWNRLHGSIAHLGDHAVLELAGSARGALADMLRYVDVTPIGRWTGRALAGASGSGVADLDLALSIPLDDTSQTQVKGTLVLAGNDVRMRADTPMLAAAKARIEFTQNAFSVAAGSARVLGGLLAFEGGSQGSGTQRFSGQGTLTADALRRAGELGAVARFGNVLQGQANYRATLAFVDGRPQIGVSSDLVGMTVALPAPLGKTSETPLALRVQTSVDAPVQPGRPELETTSVDLGNAFAARFVRDPSAGAARAVRGSIRLADPAFADAAPASPPPPLPASGVVAVATLKHLDVDAWQSAFDRLGDDGVGPGVGAPSAGPGGSDYVPDTLALRVGELENGSRRLTDLTAGLSQQGGLWRANVSARELDGYLEYRPARRGAGVAAAGRVFARLSRLSLPKGQDERVESLLDEQPESVPALDIVADDFELRGKHLGRLEVVAANRSTSGRDAAREWELSKLNLDMPEAHLVASGTWGGVESGRADAPRVAAMTFKLTLLDSGALLERLGMGKVVRGGKGSLSGDVSWPGSPLSPDTSRMSGHMRLTVDAGQFLKAGPGAARVLSVLSLQSLPRRLLFDFRDLFEAGFAFDNVTGDIGIGHGVATTNNLRMRGAAAVVFLDGSADLEHETEDVRVVVVPEINAGTASLAYAIINPAVGLGTFLAQYFLRKPLMAASTREFRVTGPWDEPKVERIERPMFGASDAIDSPAAAAQNQPTTNR